MKIRPDFLNPSTFFIFIEFYFNGKIVKYNHQGYPKL